MTVFAVYNYRFELRGWLTASSASEALRMVPQLYPLVFGAMVEPDKETQ